MWEYVAQAYAKSVKDEVVKMSTEDVITPTLFGKGVSSLWL